MYVLGFLKKNFSKFLGYWEFVIKVPYTCMGFCYVKWFGQTSSSVLLIRVLKYVRFCFWIRRDIQLFKHSAYFQYIHSAYSQYNSAYSQYTYNFALHLSIKTDSFRVFSVYKQIHTVYLAIRTTKFHSKIFLVLGILCICTNPSAFSQYTNGFIPRILSTVYIQIQSAYSASGLK